MGSEDQDTTPVELNATAPFAARLNEHGYPFHYAVLERARREFDADRSKFVFWRAELPVELRGKETRIDGILARFGANPTRAVHVVIETKRINPAWASWCFARSPYTTRDVTTTERFVVDDIHRDRPNGKFQFGAQTIHYFTGGYHIGFEAKTNRKGDPCPKGATIEDAVAQALRGSAGLIDTYATNTYLPDVHRVTVIPVVVTTAALWVTDAHLESADITTGDLAAAAFKRVAVVFYQYNRSPSLTPALPTRPSVNRLSELADREYVRTVPIVNPDGLDTLLTELSELDELIR